MRVLYFDIDGALLDWYDRPKAALDGGSFQSALAAHGFESLVCVSGWADMVQMDAVRIPPAARGAAIHRLVAPLFPDRAWFLDRLVLGTDTDHRGRLIDRSLDWYYLDDNADQFFTAAFGPDAYRAELGRRICRPHHSDDGSGVLTWLAAVPG